MSRGKKAGHKTQEDPFNEAESLLEQGPVIERLKEVVEPFSRAENFELVHIEVGASNREKVVRIFMDKPGGITLDDCVYASRQLGDLIDVHIEDMGRYRLEVSSPGPNRPLNTKDDFYRFKDHRIRIETHTPVDGRQKFTGMLEAINNDSVVIAVDGNPFEIADAVISKAMLAG